MRVCARCGGPNNDNARFCSQCGASLAGAPAGRERKLITALFCDLVGSTALGERLDPEDLEYVLDAYGKITRKHIEAHGGVLEKFIGDAAVGVFGVPLAHEDDAARAVRAALAIIQELAASDLGLRARIGVNTGEALVRTVLDTGSGEPFARGDAMNTAARLEAAAPTMGILVGKATRDAAAGDFLFREVEPIAAKGKAERVPAWLVAGPVSSLAPATLFVGRAVELELVRGVLERSIDGRHPDAVTVIGEPGIGESRLLAEVQRSLRAGGIDVYVGRCVSYGDTTGFAPLADVVKGYARLGPGDSQLRVTEKLTGALRGENRTPWLVDRLGPLVGLTRDSAVPGRDEAFAAFRAFLERVASSGPVVVFIEDLHWASEALIGFFVEALDFWDDLPLAIAGSGRPEATERLSGLGWPGQIVQLGPLSDRDVHHLVEPLLPPALRAVVQERADGNPLFVQQLAAMIQDATVTGDAALLASVPTSLRGVLESRLDALPPSQRSVTQDASVVGKRFWLGALARLASRDTSVIGQDLAYVADRALARASHPSSIAGETEFEFSHALVQEVTYATLTRAARMTRHEATAKWLEKMLGDDLAEHAELVVHHYERALEVAIATGGDSRAMQAGLLRALRQAAETARRTDLPRARDRLLRALELASSDGPQRADVLLELGRVQRMLGANEAARRSFEDGSALYESVGRRDRASEAALAAAPIIWMMGDTDALATTMRRARSLLADGRGPALVRLLSEEAHLLRVEGRDRESTIKAQSALDLAEELGMSPPYRALALMGYSRLFSGDAGGEDDVSGAIDEAIRQGDPTSALSSAMNLGTVAMDLFGPTRALAAYDRAIALAQQYGLAEEGAARAARLSALITAGRLIEAEREAQEIIAPAQRSGDVWTRMWAEQSLLQVRRERGAPQDQQGIEFLLSTGTMSGAFALHPSVASVLFEMGRRDEGEAVLYGTVEAYEGELRGVVEIVRACLGYGPRLEELASRALSLATPISEWDHLEMLHGTAMTAESRHEIEDSLEKYTDAAVRLHDFGDRFEEAHALAGQGRCLARLSSVSEARVAFADARSLWTEMEARRRIEELGAVEQGLIRGQSGTFPGLDYY